MFTICVIVDRGTDIHQLDKGFNYPVAVFMPITGGRGNNNEWDLEGLIEKNRFVDQPLNTVRFAMVGSENYNCIVHLSTSFNAGETFANLSVY